LFIKCAGGEWVHISMVFYFDEVGVFFDDLLIHNQEAG
jgi:hypothetical protein